MMDYADAWTSDPHRCKRYICEEDDGHPTTCPEPPVVKGWRSDDRGRWYRVLACRRHAHLVATPGRGRLVGLESLP